MCERVTVRELASPLSTWTCPPSRGPRGAGTGDATCQIELQLLPELQELPAVAKVTAVMPLQASTWLDAVLDAAAREESVHQASIALKSLGESAAQRSVILVEHLRNSQRMRQHYDTLRQIFVPEEQ